MCNISWGVLIFAWAITIWPDTTAGSLPRLFPRILGPRKCSSRRRFAAIAYFMDRYPSSAFRDSSQVLVDALIAKLQRKSFENAALYHRTQQYKSASIALRNALKEYPDTPYREEIQWLILDSHYQYARQSTERRKWERYNEALEAFLTFAARFPDSKRMPDALRIQKACLSEMERLKSTASNSTP